MTAICRCFSLTHPYAATDAGRKGNSIRTLFKRICFRVRLKYPPKEASLLHLRRANTSILGFRDSENVVWPSTAQNTPKNASYSGVRKTGEGRGKSPTNSESQKHKANLKRIVPVTAGQCSRARVCYRVVECECKPWNKGINTTGRGEYLMDVPEANRITRLLGRHKTWIMGFTGLKSRKDNFNSSTLGTGLAEGLCASTSIFVTSTPVGGCFSSKRDLSFSSILTFGFVAAMSAILEVPDLCRAVSASFRCRRRRRSVVW